MKIFDCKLLLFLLVAFATVAHASEHTGYWNESTQEGDSFPCEGVTTEERMKEVLRSAGWNMKDGIPRIDWENDEAVIIAPSEYSEYYRSGDLAFYKLYRENDSIVLEYGWKQIVNVTITTETRGVQVTTLGSVAAAGPATIVVSFRRGLDRGLKFVCRNMGLRP